MSEPLVAPDIAKLVVAPDIDMEEQHISQLLGCHIGNVSFKDGATASTAVLDMGSLLPPDQAPDQLGQSKSC